MGAFRDISGQAYGYWTVLHKCDLRGPRGEIFWQCVCACGNRREVLGSNLLKGVSTSCGCTRDIGVRSKTHGHATNKGISPTYHSWAGMKARCTNPNNTHFQYYGAMGISVCERWMKFENFLSDMGEKPPGKSIDRVDPSGDYTPQNCRWADGKSQANNKNNSRLITALGQTLTLQQWAEKLGVTHGTIIFRIDKAGWPLEKALTTPSRGYGGRKPAS